MELQHAAEQSLGICKRLFHFLLESFSFRKSKEINSTIREAGTEVPVAVYRHGNLGAVAAPTEVPVESPGRWELKTDEEPKKGIKKSVTIKDDPEVIRADIKKKTPSMPAKNIDAGEKEVDKKQEAVPAAKLSKVISDINKRALDYIKKRQRILEKTASNEAFGHS